jgi:putative ubiquitin-RnfH superfamily antitoxin RatB of RatAB toxin-antitoxin module
MRCTLVCDVAPEPVILEIELRAPATVQQLLELTRARLGEISADWEHAPVGIWGQECPRTQQLRAGDRVEIYRLLPTDPKQARRERVRRRGR